MSKTFITRTTLDEVKNLEDLTDLKRVNSMNESEIEANALSDPDNQPLSPDSLKKIKQIKPKISKES